MVLKYGFRQYTEIQVKSIAEEQASRDAWIDLKRVKACYVEVHDSFDFVPVAAASIFNVRQQPIECYVASYQRSS